MKPANYVGQKFARLTVLSRAENNKHGNTRWNCLCECGNKATVLGTKLKRGQTRSCGCLRTEWVTTQRPRGRKYKSCAIEGCARPNSGKYCGTHRARLNRYGRLHLIRRPNGTGNINAAGYIDVMIRGRRTYEHVLVAEKVIGRGLPEGAVVHHINETKSDNRPQNLVICPDDKYHKLLHRRQRALDACGNADYVKCPQCQKYDDPKNYPRQNTHAECLRKYGRDRRQQTA